MVASWSLPANAHAQSRVGMLRFEGPAAARARKLVAHALARSEDVRVVPSAEVLRAKRKLGLDLRRAEGRAALGHALSLDAGVAATTKRNRRGVQLTLRVYSATSGDLVAETQLHGSTKTLARRIAAWLPAQLRDASAPPPAEPAPQAALQAANDEAPPQEREPPGESAIAPEPEASTPVLGAPTAEARADETRESSESSGANEPSESSEPSDSGRRPHSLELALGTTALARSVEYVHGSPGLLEQHAQLTPAVQLSARWYPWIENLGLDLRARGALPVDVAWGASKFASTSLLFAAALRLRLPVAAHELGAFAGGGVHDQHVARSQFGERPRAPGVSYRFVRIGADARIALGDALSLDVEAAYLSLDGYGAILDTAWFPHASTGTGVEAELGTSYALSRAFSLQFALGFVRCEIPLHVQRDDLGVIVFNRAASSVVDRQLYVLLGARLQP
jgi:hypothetical protein